MAVLEVVGVRSMNKKEMQRYLDQQAADGKTEIEAYRNLMFVLGLRFGEEPKKDDPEQ